MRKLKGFTIIELLIVVAIVGILATIVIVSLREASERSRDAKIVTDVVQVRKIAEEMYIQEFSYDNLCSGGDLNTSYSESLQTIKDDIENYYGGSNIITCYSGQRSYCVSAPLTGATTQYFCIDDEGNNTEAASDPCVNADSTCE